MARSTKTDKARQLNAAFVMLRRNMPLPEAMHRLSRDFELSERQAYRYLAEAMRMKCPVEWARTGSKMSMVRVMEM